MLLTLNTLNDSIASNEQVNHSSFLMPVLIGLLIIALVITGLLIYSIYFNKKSVPQTNTSSVEKLTFKTQPKILYTENEAQTVAVESIATNSKSESRKNRIIKDVDEKKSVVIKADPLRTWEEKVKATTIKKPDISPTSAIPVPERKIELLINTKGEEIVESEIKLQGNQIGYNPSNNFRQTEPLSYPFVLMPEPNSIVKYPQRGKTGRKGYTEERFKNYLIKHFSNDFFINDDHSLLVRGQLRPFEPDFSLNDKMSRNILIDIEIDEPYQGINDIENRKPTHYVGVDDQRNSAFIKRGWIVIRFAEIQVHQSPDACCRFVADVIKEIIREYKIPSSLKKITRPEMITLWTKVEAMVWSSQRYRENYLSIADFGYTDEKVQPQNVAETEYGKAVEDLIEEKAPFEIKNNDEKYSAYDHICYQIKDAVYRETYLLIDYNTATRIVKPIALNQTFLKAFCFVKNTNIDFKISQIRSASMESEYYLERFIRPTKNRIEEIFELAQIIRKPVRVKYMSGNTLDKSTGELIDNFKYHAISNMKPVEDGFRKTKDGEFKVKKGVHFDATNLAYGSTITLKFDRISEIELLNT